MMHMCETKANYYKNNQSTYEIHHSCIPQDKKINSEIEQIGTWIHLHSCTRTLYNHNNNVAATKRILENTLW